MLEYNAIKVAILVIVFFVIPLAVSAIHRVRLAKHERERGISREQFCLAFEREGIPARVPLAVYDHYHKTPLWANYSVAPDDSLMETLRIPAEDVADDVEVLLSRLGYKVVDETELLESKRSARSVRDVVRLLDQIRRKQE